MLVITPRITMVKLTTRDVAPHTESLILLYSAVVQPFVAVKHDLVLVCPSFSVIRSQKWLPAKSSCAFCEPWKQLAATSLHWVDAASMAAWNFLGSSLALTEEEKTATPTRRQMRVVDADDVMVMLFRSYSRGTCVYASGVETMLWKNIGGIIKK
ncbi:hypothetical protein PoB_006527600 [Plakobranchus ocellatus]|uniref:Uncharacterized protein n=1 Tax=Plakobranchus ocellatus TaxID=259542 RepID=A0AAV4D3K7_9GAST|nr:hypothetical protein PoB_006527600 [Plakobranchus ocellatus]